MIFCVLRRLRGLYILRHDKWGAKMNYKRGLFRIWILVSVLWIVGCAGFAYIHYSTAYPAGRNYQYVIQTKKMPWETDWTKPIYEIAFAPGKGKFPEAFQLIDDKYLDGFNKAVNAGTKKTVDMTNMDTLYISAEYNQNDVAILSDEFEAQWWGRFFSDYKPYAIGAIVPPVCLLILGFLIGWVIAGFRKSIYP